VQHEDRHGIVPQSHGSGSSDPEPGGWGAIVAQKESYIELHSGKADTISTEMELIELGEAFLRIQIAIQRVMG
jgi:ribonuclease HI